MSKAIILSLAALTFLSACGTDEQQPQQQRYGYNRNPGQVGPRGPGDGFGPRPGGVINNQCHARVTQDWNKLIAARCNNVRGDEQADACVSGAERFRHKYPNIICNIAVADTQWGPGNWQAQTWFEINDSVIYGIFYHHGRNSPGRGGWTAPPDAPNGPGPGGPSGPGHGGFPGQPR